MQRTLVLVGFFALCGCGQRSTEPPAVVAKQPNVVQVTTVSGFDDDAEPEIHHMADGSLQVIFSFMPPTFVLDEDVRAVESFQDFDQQLSRAVGLPVVWEDRERFTIKSPEKDSAEKIKQFLESYRKDKDPRHSQSS